MNNLESYHHSADCICKRYFDVDADGEMEGQTDLEELLAYAHLDHLLHSVKGYIEVKYPEVYADFFSYLDEEDN